MHTWSDLNEKPRKIWFVLVSWSRSPAKIHFRLNKPLNWMKHKVCIVSKFLWFVSLLRWMLTQNVCLQAKPAIHIFNMERIETNRICDKQLHLLLCTTYLCEMESCHGSIKSRTFRRISFIKFHFGKTVYYQCWTHVVVVGVCAWNDDMC